MVEEEKDGRKRDFVVKYYAMEKPDNPWTLYGHQRGFGENNKNDDKAGKPNKIRT